MKKRIFWLLLLPLSFAVGLLLLPSWQPQNPWQPRPANYLSLLIPGKTVPATESPTAHTENGEARLQALLGKAGPQTEPVLALPPLLQEAHKPGTPLWFLADTLRFGTRFPTGFAEDMSPTVFPSEDSRRYKPLTGELREHLRDLAGRAAKQEPDNAYFPIMAALYAFAGSQEQRGWQFIRRAAACSRYEDYLLEESQRRSALAQRTGIFSWHKRLLSYLLIQTTHYRKFRMLGRHLCSQGEAARDAGNTRLAWLRFESALALGRHLTRNPSMYRQLLTGQSIIRTAWVRAIFKTEQEPKRPQSQNEAQYRVHLAKAYGARALQWGGEPEVVARSMRDTRLWDSNALLARKLDGALAPGIPLSALTVSFKVEWLKLWLTRMAWVSILLGLIGLGGTVIWRGKPTKRISWTWLRWLAPLFVIFSSCGIWLRPNWHRNWDLGELWNSEFTAGIIPAALGGSLSYILLAIGLLPPILYLFITLALAENQLHKAPKNEATRLSPIMERVLNGTGNFIVCVGICLLVLAGMGTEDMEFLTTWPGPVGVLISILLITVGWGLRYSSLRGVSRRSWQRYVLTLRRRTHDGCLVLSCYMASLACWSTLTFIFILVGSSYWNRQLDSKSMDLQQRGEVAVWQDTAK